MSSSSAQPSAAVPANRIKVRRNGEFTEPPQSLVVKGITTFCRLLDEVRVQWQALDRMPRSPPHPALAPSHPLTGLPGVKVVGLPCGKVVRPGRRCGSFFGRHRLRGVVRCRGQRAFDDASWLRHGKPGPDGHQASAEQTAVARRKPGRRSITIGSPDSPVEAVASCSKSVRDSCGSAWREAQPGLASVSRG